MENINLTDFMFTIMTPVGKLKPRRIAKEMEERGFQIFEGSKLNGESYQLRVFATLTLQSELEYNQKAILQYLRDLGFAAYRCVLG